MRIEPAPSAATAAGTRPAATAAAEPPLEPPGVRSVSHGLRVTPHVIDSVNGHSPSSRIFVLPTTIAPASRSRRTTSESAPAGSRDRPGPAARDLAADVHLVLDRDRDAGQRPRSRVAGLAQRLLGVDGPERVQLRVEALDPAQRQLDQLARRHLAVAHQLRLAGEAGEGEVGHDAESTCPSGVPSSLSTKGGRGG